MLVKSLVKTGYIIFSIIFLSYLLLPNLSFPEPPPDSLQSLEPADLENQFRRSYFTNFGREFIIKYYQKKFKLLIFDKSLPSVRLNYPPEEAKTLIRDQTRSTYLEEIVYPFRESLFINGFEPTSEKDTIIVSGQKWHQKVTLKYVPSNAFARLMLGIASLILIYFVFKKAISVGSEIKKEFL